MGLCQRPPSRPRGGLILCCEVQELAGKWRKPAQDVAFPRSFRPALPTALLSVERIIPFFALVEHGLRYRLEIWDASKVGFKETRDLDVQLS